MSTNFVAPFDPSDEEARAIVDAAGAPRRLMVHPVWLPGQNGLLLNVQSLLGSRCRQLLLEALTKPTWLPAPENGYQKEYREGDPAASWRASWYSQAFADALWARLLPHVPSRRYFDERGNGDWDGTHIWIATGVNPLMRFMRYRESGKLIPHYDAPYIADRDNRTLMSLVIYLDEGAEGGATQFLDDHQALLPFSERDFSDQPHATPPVAFSQSPRAGEALLFDHRMLHQGQEVLSGVKTIIRTDIFFRRGEA